MLICVEHVKSFFITLGPDLLLCPKDNMHYNKFLVKAGLRSRQTAYQLLALLSQLNISASSLAFGSLQVRCPCLSPVAQSYFESKLFHFCVEF